MSYFKRLVIGRTPKLTTQAVVPNLVLHGGDLQERLSHHPRYGDSELQQPGLNGKVFFAGTETARQHGGGPEKVRSSGCFGTVGQGI